MWEKFKSILADEQIFASILIILVGVISFGLGRTSISTPADTVETTRIELAPEPFIMPANDGGAVAGVTTDSSGADVSAAAQRLVASKTGARYHLLDCPSAGQIKESNKVYFATPAEAEAAGYTKAANCPGL